MWLNLTVPNKKNLQKIIYNYWSFIFFTGIFQLDNLYHLNYSRLSIGKGWEKIKNNSNF